MTAGTSRRMRLLKLWTMRDGGAPAAAPPPAPQTLVIDPLDVQPGGPATAVPVEQAAAVIPSERPILRAGRIAWALLGLAAAATVIGFVAAQLSIVVVPLVLALFPAAILAPAVGWLTRRGVPQTVAALVTLLGALLLIAGIGAALVPAVASQLEGLGGSAQEGIADVEAFLASRPLGLPAISLDQLIRGFREQVGGSGRGVFGAAIAVVEGIAGFFFLLVALFFYLKDGPQLAAALRDTFPRKLRPDVTEVGARAWQTLGGYIRGQALIAAVDAVLIGVAIAVLGVPLLLPLTVLVFIGGLVPVLGAFVTGGLAVLVALGTKGLTTALILLAVIVVVQEVEGDVLAPLVLGKTTALHPLMALAALAGGAVLLGVLGAFLAIPVTAAVARAVEYMRERVPG